ncbi:MAG: hypothetical protein E7236_06045 [Lachnospiraceae bacterium]|nr:hypothetical protein [Lachnospiraceae bacterium]
MQIDFHYYATYCAAYLAGYPHEESLAIAYSAQMVDCCSETFVSKVQAPRAAVTTQQQLELADTRADLLGLQNITRIWASFHFLPGNLYAEIPKRPRIYKNKYRLICDVNSDLLVDTVHLAKGKSLQAAGIAMHVLADTWAHRYFAGTPSLVINNTDYYFFELIATEEGETERQVSFINNPLKGDDIKQSIYVNSLYQGNENSIMNLGHGRAGHLPDYSFIRYKYLPSWGQYAEIIKDNPADYYSAFTQMVYALKYLRGITDVFEKDTYDTVSVAPWEERIHEILKKRQLDASADWKDLGEALSGQTIPDFDQDQCQAEYMHAERKGKDGTVLGQFILAALAQKSMVTNKIYKSGNRLAGISIDYNQHGLKGIRDYFKLIEEAGRGDAHE